MVPPCPDRTIQTSSDTLLKLREGHSCVCESFLDPARLLEHRELRSKYFDSGDLSRCMSPLDSLARSEDGRQ